MKTSWKGKKIKRLRYISEKIFLELLDGYPLSVLASKGETIQNGEVLVHSDEVSLLPKDIRDNRMPIWLVNRRPRVSVDRVNSASEIYYSGQTVFSPDCGLWFAVRWYDYSEVLTSTFEEALLFLGDAGIGGERSSGMGKAFFKKQNTKADLSYSTNTEWVALSRYIPAVDECTVLNNQQAFYSLEKVGGWISSGTERGQRRICLRMLSEGSVFGPIEKAVLGSILNVAPVFLDNQKREVRPLTYPVWRSGLAFPVSFKRELR
jgi:CRISPR-associated protein Csm4